MIGNIIIIIWYFSLEFNGKLKKYLTNELGWEIMNIATEILKCLFMGFF